VEFVNPFRNRGNRPFSEKGRDLSGAIIGFQQNRLRGETEGLGGFLGGLGGLGGGGGGDSLFFEQSGEGDQLGGGDSLLTHSVDS
jgi:hypothetical protein